MPKFIRHSRIPRAGSALDRFIEQQELTIREALTAKSGRGRFNPRRISERRGSRTKLLKKARQLPAEKLHQGFSSLNTGRRSAACPFEAMRLRIWLLTEVHKHLSPEASYLVTLANPKWSQPMGPLSPDCFNPIISKLRATVAMLRAAGHIVRGVAVLELCADRGLNGKLSWSPHLHVVICGVNKATIHGAFRVRLPAGRRGKDKPLQVTLIKPGELLCSFASSLVMIFPFRL
jgi:hypothetical protein